MGMQLRREIARIDCPEGRGKTSLLLEWSDSGQGKELNGASCSNPLLKDLSGRDCDWTCWGTVTTIEGG